MLFHYFFYLTSKAYDINLAKYITGQRLDGEAVLGGLVFLLVGYEWAYCTLCDALVFSLTRL